MSQNKEIGALGVIPARMGSSRFPGKPLKLLHGKPMVWHVWKRCMLSNKLDDVIIATCDREIEEAAKKWGARTMMTSERHDRANDRVAEVAENVQCRNILNVQGDEPLVNPQLIDDVVDKLMESKKVECVNPIAEMKTKEEILSPNTVKVVMSMTGRVLLFSRLPLPWSDAAERTFPVYRQVPIIGFSREFCMKLANLGTGPLEKQERIDMLCAIENDIPLYAMVTKYQTVGVDTPEDLKNVEKIMQTDSIFQKYEKD